MGPNDAPRRFGVEEEYLLLDSERGVPVDRAAELIALMPELREQAEREYFSSQLETATPICRDAEEAESALAGFRASLSRSALEHGIVLAGTGLPPLGGEVAGTVTPKPRYLVIEEAMREVGARQYSTGTHVHVEVPSPDAGVDVLARIARWAPALLALTSNSPLWCGEETGFASWRHIMGRSWPASGYPEGFEDAEDYRRAVDGLIGTGVLTWVARLSERYPTVELRIADAQLDAGDAVAFAVVVRALVDRALRDGANGRPRPRYAPGLLNGAIWLAARNGLLGELIDPFTADRAPADTMIERMMSTIEGELDRCGDRSRVEGYLLKQRETGGPARLQSRTFEEFGIEGLLRLYLRGSAAAPIPEPALSPAVPA